MGVRIPVLSHSDNFLQIRNPTDFQTHSDWDSGAHLIHGRWALVSPRRETTRALKSVEILSTAAQLYEKSHLTKRIALSCGIKISPVGSLD